jgi:hypothetical protein
MHDEKELRWYDRMGVQRPSHQPHGTIEDIQASMSQAKAKNWRMEGNKLIADTDMGELVQWLPTDIICKGTDDQGLPILTRIKT